MNKLKRIKKPSGLILVAVFLACAGSLYFGEGIGTALARQNDGTVAASIEPLTCPEPSIVLAEKLKERNAAVNAREVALRDRWAALSLAEETIKARISELTDAEKSLAETLAIADKAAENDLLKLTSMYEAMKSDEAANLFQTMAPEFAAGFLTRMRPEVAAAIISGMDVDAAYTVSVLIAGRNAKAPKS